MNKIYLIICIIILLLFINSINYIEPFINHSLSTTYELPKVIYGFWDDLDTNIVIKSHIRNWRKKIPKEWNIIILNKNNVYKYVDSEFLNKFASGQIDSTRFSDFLRLYLLIKNGGCWLDASLFIVNGNFLNQYHEEMVKNKFDGCFYEYTELSTSDLQPHIDNWFMMAPKNSKILIDLYNEFEKAFDMDFLNYKRRVLIPSGILLDKTIGYEDSTYLLQHAIFHYLFKKGNKYNILLKSASESMYKIQEIFSWDHEKVIQFIMLNNNWDGFYGIKLTKQNRNEIIDKNKYVKIIDNF